MIRRATGLVGAILGIALGPAAFEVRASDAWSSPKCSFIPAGWVGERVDANVNHWLLPAPSANPGMLEMFRMRDREPAPQLVPWAGEFAGKYLHSAVESLRLTADPQLEAHIRRFVRELIDTQDENGYLGPFPKSQQLLGNWDLWGHYHVMQGLLEWHDFSSDADAVAACRRAADLVCRTYLDGGRRAIDAGSDEMNLSIIHGLGRLHRLTGEPRYFALMREIERDWERAGDYLRTGVAGIEFYRTPRPRWESLHGLQGLAELWRITGDEKYRTAFGNHWRSIARNDIRNTGGFSGGEQATGNPWSPSAIETCCTVAWMAMTIDCLRMTGDPLALDLLELAFVNAAMGAQHPSGRWWTYNTPMDGAREASAHSIVFQARAGTPELNCCSVNGPRTLGMLAHWAVMDDGSGLVINWHGAGRLGTDQFELECESGYPFDASKVTWRVVRAPREPLRLRFRIPGWARGPVRAALNGESVETGSHSLAITRAWKTGDVVGIEFSPELRAVAGDREALGRVSIYYGPVLLAFDPKHNAFDEAAIPPVDSRSLSRAAISTGDGSVHLFVELPDRDGKRLRLCDFASAGRSGTRYRTWLAAVNPPPPPPIARAPRDLAIVGKGPAVFRWTGSGDSSLVDSYRLVISANDDARKPVVVREAIASRRWELDDEARARLEPGKTYLWHAIACGPGGESVAPEPWMRFIHDPARASTPGDEVPIREDGVVVEASLRDRVDPGFGRLVRNAGAVPTPDGLLTDGRSQMAVFALPEDFGEAGTVVVTFRVRELPANRLGQVFSAWCRPSDDPLRLAIENGKLFARIEAGAACSTAGFPVETGRWHRVVAVRSGQTIKLFIDGRDAGTAKLPAPAPASSAVDFALGGNPHFTGNEFLAADFRDLEVRARALPDAEARALSEPKS
jgi:DUF1680 family protein